MWLGGGVGEEKEKERKDNGVLYQTFIKAISTLLDFMFWVHYTGDEFPIVYVLGTEADWKSLLNIT